MYSVRPTTKFQKDLKRIEKRGYNIALITDNILHAQEHIVICFNKTDAEVSVCIG